MADPTIKRFDKPFNVQLDETHRAMLNQLALKNSVPGSQIIRAGIEMRYRMEFNSEPRCMTTAQCLCPAVHVAPRTAQISATELLAQRTAGNGAA